MYVLSVLVEATWDDLVRGLSSWQTGATSTDTPNEASPSVVIGTSTYEAYLASFVPAAFRDRPHTFLKNVAFDQIAAAVWNLGELNIADAPVLRGPTGTHDSVHIIPGEVVDLFRWATDETLRKCAKRAASSLVFTGNYEDSTLAPITP